jgi:hypothetical protein
MPRVRNSPTRDLHPRIKMDRPRHTNTTLLADPVQKSPCRLERTGRRPAESQPKCRVYAGCMRGVFLPVRFPARCVCLPSPRPRARIMHHRDWTCTTATDRHAGGTGKNTNRLRRNICGVFETQRTPTGQNTNKNAAKHEFMSPLTTKWPLSTKTLYALKYAR